ncbi:DUF6998 domain-containing protein [Lentzea cavernae]|uniref:Uncharacterized protein n=1 Tax=Lentzea cavernae TaxID=2020703 RepID=A0ABQ3MM88_9PSEU|nr:hypothetical protein [Lentzea cavernae]GHH47885.1 hypothetical protein GCM10017774_52860 [Lentzea cavernae]
MSEDVRRVAELIRERNRIDAALAACIRRPALPGHLGDWIAARILGIALVPHANRGVDGRLADGRTVNVRWSTKREGILDLHENGPEVYLVLAGPKSAPSSSVGTSRPLVIEAVYLFDAAALMDDLRARGRKIGTASSVRDELWEAAEIYPRPNTAFPLTDAQRELLALFSHQP